MMQGIKKLLEPKKLLFIATGYTVLITVAFLLPGKDIPPTGLPIDKVVHIAFYVVLVLSWLLFFYKKNELQVKKQITVVLVIASLFYGIVIEALQENFIPLRHADIWDLVANTIGIALGVLLFYKTKIFFGNQN